MDEPLALSEQVNLALPGEQRVRGAGGDARGVLPEHVSRQGIDGDKRPSGVASEQPSPSVPFQVQRVANTWIGQQRTDERKRECREIARCECWLTEVGGIGSAAAVRIETLGAARI